MCDLSVSLTPWRRGEDREGEGEGGRVCVCGEETPGPAAGEGRRRKHHHTFTPSTLPSSSSSPLIAAASATTSAEEDLRAPFGSIIK